VPGVAISLIASIKAVQPNLLFLVRVMNSAKALQVGPATTQIAVITFLANVLVVVWQYQQEAI